MGRSSRYCEIYIQKLDQIPRGNIRKILLGFWQEKGKRNHFEMYQSTQFFPTRPALIGCYQSLADLGKGKHPSQIRSSILHRREEATHLQPTPPILSHPKRAGAGGLEKHMWSSLPRGTDPLKDWIPILGLQNATLPSNLTNTFL